MTPTLPGLATSATYTQAVVLAQQPDNGGQGEDAGKASPVGLVVLILFLVAVVLLVRSMTKHLKRVPASFDTDTTNTTDTPGTTEPDGPGETEQDRGDGQR